MSLKVDNTCGGFPPQKPSSHYSSCSSHYEMKSLCFPISISNITASSCTCISLPTAPPTHQRTTSRRATLHLDIVVPCNILHPRSPSKYLSLWFASRACLLYCTTTCLAKHPSHGTSQSGRRCLINSELNSIQRVVFLLCAFQTQNI